MTCRVAISNTKKMRMTTQHNHKNDKRSLVHTIESEPTTLGTTIDGTGGEGIEMSGTRKKNGARKSKGGEVWRLCFGDDETGRWKWRWIG